jgi:putative tryptophan/tyrosine transport system substrate-binding protein
MLRRVLALGDQMKSRRVKQREFITLLGGAATAWPLTAHAQQGERVRRVGVLVGLPADDDELQTRYAAFLQEFAELGWAVGRNLRIDTRWGASDIERIRKLATEIIALAPDVILANGSSVVGPLHQMTRAVPIVFVNLTDPLSAGLVESLARPGGNVTGFTSFEYGLPRERHGPPQYPQYQ